MLRSHCGNSFRLSLCPSPPPGTTLEAICRLLNEEATKTLPVRVSGRMARDLPSDDPPSLALEYAGDHWALSAAGRDATRPVYGIAVDVGTTTVVALLVELATGRVAASASDLNAQIALGDNVLTRINLCMQDTQNIQALQEAVTAKTFAPLIERLLEESDVDASQVAALCVAGNTTMLHLLCGVDPSPLGVYPFTPQFLEYRRLALEELPGIISQPDEAQQSVRRG